MRLQAFVESLDDERIVAAVREAESRSRGEIRVHVTDRAAADPEAQAAVVFDRLGMARTDERNGVLLFVAPESQTIVVLGDRGIHALCEEGFWAAVAHAVRDEFRSGRFTEGIVAGVHAIGDALARHFPRRPGEADRNELPDTVSRG
jgi:uncharacterized membrane protein